MIPMDGSFPMTFNTESADFLKNTPQAFQEMVCNAQMSIDSAVIGANPNAVRTSGFRSPRYNAKTKGSKPDSPHMFGFATDYRLQDDFNPVIPGMLVIVEGDHYHVQPLTWQASK